MDPSPNPFTPSVLTVEYCCTKITQLLESAHLHYGHGANNAQSEALWIVSKQLGISPTEALDLGDKPLSAKMTQDAINIAQQRISRREPLAYLLGEAWLMGIPFDCTPQSIIPRSFIAELIVHGELDPWLPADGKVLDLCTGNGSLAILTALHYPDLHITASDLSLPALALAARNVERHHVNNQIDVFHGDLWNALPDTEEDHRFDLIICNPPYVNEASMRALPPEYQAEPREALAGGLNGMDIITRIIAGAADYLNERGALVLEIGNEYEYFHQAFPHIPAIWLEVSAGDQQVCIILAEDLQK
jgi:ribosomal protein L3 glutamine methyltransferase